MKILFTADWHIKLGQKNVPVEWQKARYRSLFTKIHQLSTEVDLVINGGDIFDRMPTLEELSLYFEYVTGATCTHIIYDGNHEATKKGATFLSKLKSVTSNVNPHVKIFDDYVSSEVYDIIPYCRLKHFEKNGWAGPKAPILLTHVRGEIPPHVKPEIDLSLFSGWPTVLAGDLHAHSNSQKNIVYPGSPVSTSFHRNKITNGVIVFDTISSTYEFIDLELPQLIRKTVASVEEAKPTKIDHTVYEIKGSVLNTAGIDTSAAHIDKKIVERDTGKSLDLGNKSIEEELKEYLTKIQKLSKEETDELISAFHDYKGDIDC